MPNPRRVIDPAALKAMTHPLRLRLYYALVIARSTTATELAQSLDASVSLVSYHLRQLARYGYVEPDPDSGDDGRERWWRPTSVGFSFAPGELPGPDGEFAAADAARQLDAHRAAYRQRWLDTQGEWSMTWQDAAVSTDDPLLQMTPAELSAFGREYHELLQSWHERLTGAGTTGSGSQSESGPAVDGAKVADGAETEGSQGTGRERVLIVLQAFPFRP